VDMYTVIGLNKVCMYVCMYKYSLAVSQSRLTLHQLSVLCITGFT